MVGAWPWGSGFAGTSHPCFDCGVFHISLPFTHIFSLKKQKVYLSGSPRTPRDHGAQSEGLAVDEKKDRFEVKVGDGVCRGIGRHHHPVDSP